MVRVSTKMKKILLQLLKFEENPETSLLLTESANRYQLKENGPTIGEIAFGLFGLKVFNEEDKKLADNVRIKLQQTLTILTENELVKKSRNYGPSKEGIINIGRKRYKLTEKGRETTIQIRDEIRSFIDEFQSLL